MRGVTYHTKIRLEAAALRKRGKSYKQIQKEIGVPSSTLCTWLGHKYPEVFTEQVRMEHLGRIRKIATNSIRAAKLKRDRVYFLLGRQLARKVNAESVLYLKSLLSMLYWAEGTKHHRVSGLRFANTDPRMIYLYMALLRKCYSIDETRLRLRIHVHYYHNIEQTKRYWTRLTKIPATQLGKIWIKPRSKTRKFRENFMGLCFVSYLDSSIRKEILELAYAIQEKVAGVTPSSFNG